MPTKKTKPLDNFINDEDSETSDDEDDGEYQVKKPIKNKIKPDGKVKPELRTETKSRVSVDNDLDGNAGRRVSRSKDNDKKVNALKDLKVAREGLQKKKGE